MAQLLTDEPWHQVEPLLPPRKPRPRGGRPPAGDRAALAGILFVLKAGIGWEDLPRETGCGGMTCWRRLRDWQAAGAWDAPHRVPLDRLRGAERTDFSRAPVDSGSVRAVSGGNGPARARRAAASSAASIASWSRPRRGSAGGDRHGSEPPRRHAADPAGRRDPAGARGKRGAPLRKPGDVVAGRGCDYGCHRPAPPCRAIRTHIARRAARRTAAASGPGGGRSSGRSVGRTSSAACGPAGSGASTSTPRSCGSDARSSAGECGICRFVRGWLC